MNKLLLPALLCVVSHGAFAQVQNENFEEWTKPSLFTHPYSNVQTSSSNYNTFVKSGETNVNQIEVNGDSYMRIENISVDGAVEPGFFIFGMEPTTEGEDLVFEGGFNISDTQASGVSMDMKMDIPASNPGFVIVQFRHNETPVGAGNFGTGTYVFPISGTQDWTNLSFDFDEAIDPSSNKCVIGVSSADLLDNDLLFAEGSFVEIDNVTLNNSTDELMGGEFEFWSYITAEETPNNIQIDMDDIRNPSYLKTTLMTNEAYALQLTTMNRNGEIKPGIALMGDKTDLGEIVPTAEIQSNHSMISFLYQYTGVNDDEANVKFVFYNEMNGNFQPVFTKEFNLESSNVNMFQYDMADDRSEYFPTATMMTVEFSSSNLEMPQEGSELIVDQVQLSGSLGVLQSIGAPEVNTVFAYPNPTIGRVSFRFGEIRSGSYDVYNAQGVLIQTEYYESVRELVHHMANYPAGTYTFRFDDNSGQGVARVVKN